MSPHTSSEWIELSKRFEVFTPGLWTSQVCVDRLGGPWNECFIDFGSQELCYRVARQNTRIYPGLLSRISQRKIEYEKSGALEDPMGFYAEKGDIMKVGYHHSALPGRDKWHRQQWVSSGF